MDICKIMIATPVYSSVSVEYMESIIRLKDFYRNKDVDIQFETIVGMSVLHHSRNLLVDRFLESDNDYLFFIDSDIVFMPEAFDEILECCKESDKNIVTGVYPKKQINWEFMYYAMKNGEKDLHNYNSIFANTFSFDTENVDLSKPVEIFDNGTGFMCIQRNVLEVIDEKHDKKYYSNRISRKKLITSFFDFEVLNDTQHFVSEDIFFCRLARSFGFKVWMCPWILIGHKGEYIYTGSFSEYATLHKRYVKEKKYIDRNIDYEI